MARFLLSLAFISAFPLSAAAQAVSSSGAAWMYGVSFGTARRTTSGSFATASLPAGAGQPKSSLTTFALDLEGGRSFSDRLAVVGMFERRSGFRKSPDGWGTSGGQGAVRVWVVPRVWLEGGAGVAQLAYRASSPQAPTARWWSPAYEVAGGYEIFKGPTVTIHVFARYTAATVQGLRVNTIAIEAGLMGRK